MPALGLLLVSLGFFLMMLAQVRARGEAERSADGLRVALAERARVEEQLREADRRKDDFLAMLEVLEMDGHQVTVVHDGMAALERMSAVDPEVIFPDIGLPGMDGDEVARRIRERSGGAGPRLVAVTGYGQASDRQRAREAGFDAHLVKPVALDRVRELVTDAGDGGSSASVLN